MRALLLALLLPACAGSDCPEPEPAPEPAPMEAPTGLQSAECEKLKQASSIAAAMDPETVRALLEACGIK